MYSGVFRKPTIDHTQYSPEKQRKRTTCVHFDFPPHLRYSISMTVRYIVFLSISAVLAFADTPLLKWEIDKGNSLMKRSKYDEAYAQYERSRETSSNAALIYDFGNACYRQGKYDAALAAYQAALPGADRALKIRAYCNSGNALAQTGDYTNAIRSIASALMLDPADREAKRALEAVLAMMRQTNRNDKQDQKDNGKSGSSQNQKKPDGKSGSADNRAQKNEEKQNTRPKKMTKDQAAQILNAMRIKEQDDKAKSGRNAKQFSQETYVEKDW